MIIDNLLPEFLAGRRENLKSSLKSLPRYILQREFNEIMENLANGTMNKLHSKLLGEFFETAEDPIKAFCMYVNYYLASGRPKDYGRKIIQLNKTIVEKELFYCPEYFRALKMWHQERFTDPYYCFTVSEAFKKFKLRGRALDFKEKCLSLLSRRGKPLCLERLNKLKKKKGCLKKLTAQRQSVLFFTMHCAGASAIEPVISEILYEDKLYDVVSHPWWGEFLNLYFRSETAPIYYWTHDSIEKFKFLPFKKVLCLYRDPRDAFVSYAHHHISSVKRGYFEGFGDGSLKDTFKGLFEYQMEFLRSTAQYMSLSDKQCLKFSFEEMKRDLPAMVNRILNFLELKVEEEKVKEKCKKYSFEAVTGRKEGEDGEPVGIGYFWRKGVSGDWINHFDREIKELTADKFQPYLEAWGYEKDLSWVNRKS